MAGVFNNLENSSAPPGLIRIALVPRRCEAALAQTAGYFHLRLRRAIRHADPALPKGNNPLPRDHSFT
jgi:hypothetical protein